MQRDISNFRKSYSKNIINEDSVPESPVNLFDNWFNDATSIKGDFEPNAMTLSTIDNKGFPKGRVVLLKFYSDEGFIFLQTTTVKNLFLFLIIIKFLYLFFGNN